MENYNPFNNPEIPDTPEPQEEQESSESIFDVKETEVTEPGAEDVHFVLGSIGTNANENEKNLLKEIERQFESGTLTAEEAINQAADISKKMGGNA